MTAVLLATAAILFRVVPLACTGDRLAIAGGGVLHLRTASDCARITPGRAIAIALDADGRVAPEPLDTTARPSAELPRIAFFFAPAATAPSESTLVSVTIDIIVPPRTPPDDDIYLSTDRSGWSPAEIRMDRVDARHYRITLRLRADARVAFRVTRGASATMERDASGAMSAAHTIQGTPNTPITVVVSAWADVP